MHSRLLVLLAVAGSSLLPLLNVSAGGCHTFYPDLCEGPYSCMCTKYEPCGSVENRSNAMLTNAGGGSGSCRTVIHDECRGPDSCMKDAGPCILPTPQPATASTRWGVDFSAAFHSETFECLARHNISFGVVRAHHSDGGLDTNAAPMIQKMRAAGFSQVDAYLFPCTTFDAGHTASHQVHNTVKYLMDHNAKPDRIWFDIEGNLDPHCAWSRTNTTHNIDFIKQLIAAAHDVTRTEGIEFGIYCGKEWPTLFPGYTGGKHLPLWYAHYDYVQSFQDWSPYGGWTHPTAKQYDDKIPVCNVEGGMDANWAPNGFT